MPWTSRSHFTSVCAVSRWLLQVTSQGPFQLRLLWNTSNENHWNTVGCVRGRQYITILPQWQYFPVISAFPLALPVAKSKLTTKKKWSWHTNDLSIYLRSHGCIKLWNSIWSMKTIFPSIFVSDLETTNNFAQLKIAWPPVPSKVFSLFYFDSFRPFPHLWQPFCRTSVSSSLPISPPLPQVWEMQLSRAT